MGDCWNLVLGYRPIANTNSEILFGPFMYGKGVGLKFSPTWLVERELDHLI